MRNTKKLPPNIAELYPGLDLRIPSQIRPFPGLRAGQVWAVRPPRSTLPWDYQSLHPLHHVMTITDFDAGPLGVCWFAYGVWHTDVFLKGLCEQGFLLFDPICPHLAPWAPANPSSEASV